MKIVIHRDVDLFIPTLQKPTQAKWLRSLILLEQNNIALGMPHARRITNNLFELRIRGNQEVRAFFTYIHSRIYILHAFVKKTQKIPNRELKTAEKRLDLLTRA